MRAEKDDRYNEHNWKGTQKPDTIDDRAHFHSNDLKFCCASGHSLTSASRREDGTQLRIDHVALSYLWDCSSCPFPVPCVVESIADCAQYGWLLWPAQDNNNGIWPKVWAEEIFYRDTQGKQRRAGRIEFMFCGRPFIISPDPQWKWLALFVSSSSLSNRFCIALLSCLFALGSLDMAQGPLSRWHNG